MTTYPSILKAAHLERGMRWMIFISLGLHLCLIAALLGKPPDRGTTVYFNPAYTVELIGTGGSPGLPDVPDTNESAAESSGSPANSAPTSRAEPLWKGPSGFTSQMKTIEEHTHAPLQTVTTSKLPPAIKKTAAGSGTAQGSTGAGQQGVTRSSPAGTGGQGGAGGSGSGLTPEQARFGRYYMAVFNKIQSAWVLPHYYEQKQLIATVEITIRPDGRIVKTQFEKKSGNAEFDRSVMRAVQKANPLPPLPSGIKEPLLTLGIRFQ